ncbi:hypothetical protein ACCO45_004073 [Purpureocillium lilacinum]|uniref:Uncharacterized protein n=1 Tax=Purpureocillium lilacinum TaxID=33203 RepID=A0ACC4E1Q0_PURLI
MKLVFETAMRSRRASKTTFSAGLRPSWRRGSNGVLVRELARPAVLGPHRHWAQRPLHPLCAARPGAPYPAGQPGSHGPIMRDMAWVSRASHRARFRQVRSHRHPAAAIAALPNGLADSDGFRAKACGDRGHGERRGTRGQST